VNQRQATIDHARTVLVILEDDHFLTWPVPPDVHPVALAFAQAVCDHRPELASALAASVRDTARFDSAALAHEILKHIDIIEDSPGGLTLSYAFSCWGFCEMPWIDKTLACVTAVRQAAEAICVWARETRAPLLHPACPNNPITVLAGARERLAEREAEVHA
jgi:hypothetical protein